MWKSVNQHSHIIDSLNHAWNEREWTKQSKIKICTPLTTLIDSCETLNINTIICCETERNIQIQDIFQLHTHSQQNVLNTKNAWRNNKIILQQPKNRIKCVNERERERENRKELQKKKRKNKKDCSKIVIWHNDLTNIIPWNYFENSEGRTK